MLNEKYIVVMDFSRKIVNHNACVVITQLLHEVIHRITAKSYDISVLQHKSCNANNCQGSNL